jgi:peptide/nickel transport system substrate-binding protein
VKTDGEEAQNNPIGEALWQGDPKAWKEFHQTANPYRFNLTKARELAAKAGVKQDVSVKLVTDSEPSRLLLAQNLKQAFNEINLKVQIEQVTSDQLTQRQFSAARDYDLILGGWGADFPDPAAIVVPFYLSTNRGEGGSNFANYANPKIDDLLNRLPAITDPSQRARLQIDALTLAAGDVPYLFIDHPKVSFAASKALTGYQMSPIWYWDSLFRNVWLNPKP